MASSASVVKDSNIRPNQFNITKAKPIDLTFSIDLHGFTCLNNRIRTNNPGIVQLDTVTKTVDSLPNLEWYFAVEDMEDMDRFVSCLIRLKSNGIPINTPIIYRYSFGLIDKDASTRYHSVSSYGHSDYIDLEIDKYRTVGTDYLYAEWIKDAVSLVCNLRIYPNKECYLERWNITNALNGKQESLSQFQKEISYMYDTGHLTDFTINVEGESIKVHKIILAAHSSYFRGLFENNCKETQDNSINLQGFTSKTVQIALEFVYSGKLSIALHENLIEVLAFCQLHDLSTLKDICEKLLIDTISVSNFCEFMSNAKLYEAYDLISKCVKFFNENREIIVSSMEWRELKKNNGSLVADFLEDVISSK